MFLKSICARAPVEIFVFVLLAGLAAGLPVQSAAQSDQRNIAFQRVDLNGDGFVSADEAALRHETMFSQIDIDDDDVLSLAEYLAVRFGAGPHGPGTGPRKKAMDERKRARFRSMDTDGDGVVRKLEFLDAGRQQHEAADMDRDGKVSSWEYRAARRF